MMALPFIDQLRSASARWRAAVAVAGNVALCEIGARIGLPGVDGSRVEHFFQTAHHALLTLYNLLVGGAVSRAAVLALGAIPYLEAQLYLRLGRAASPTIRRLTAEPAARRSAVRLTTFGLALVQSLGFALFLERIPGAVAEPGPGFIGRTVLLATSAALVVGWLAEAIVGAARGDAESIDIQDAQDASIQARQESAIASEGASVLVEGTSVPLLQAAGISNLSMPSAAAHRDLEATR